MRARLGMELTALLVVILLLALAGVARQVAPEPEQLIGDLADTLGWWTYVFAGGTGLLETGTIAGVVIPFELGALIGGAVAEQDAVSLVPLVAIAWACAFAGESINYYTGATAGRAFALKHGARVGLTEQALVRTEVFFARRGPLAVTLAPVIPLMRSSIPFVAGAARMPYGVFLVASLIGTLLWAILFSLLGVAFASSVDRVYDGLTYGGLALGVVIVVVLARRAQLKRAIAK